MEAVTKEDAGLLRYRKHRAANIAAGLHDPDIREMVMAILPPGIAQQAALAVLQERAEREPWVGELIEEVAASVGRCGL